MELIITSNIYGMINLPFQGAETRDFVVNPGCCRRAEMSCPSGALSAFQMAALYGNKLPLRGVVWPFISDSLFLIRYFT